MIVQKAFRFRLRPNARARNLCSQFAGGCRWIYNRGLASRKEFWEKEKKSLRLFTQNQELTVLKQQEETEWLRTIHSQVLQQALGDLDLAYRAFFRRLKQGEKPGYPHFKSKGNRDSFRYPQGVKVEADRVFLPKIGWMRFRKSREIQGTLKQTTVILNGGKWYVSFVCEFERPEPAKPSNQTVLGIDLGLTHFAIMASEKGISEIENPRYLKSELDHLRYLSRQLSRKEKLGKNWQKAKQQLQVFHARVQHKRSDFLHKLSTQLVKSHDKIVVESLKVRALLEQSPRALARAISDAGWRQFLQFLKYKCEHAAKCFVEAGSWFPSTQQCSHCGRKNPLSLGDRIYRCSCGYVAPRDHNSALNLRAVGTTV